MRSHFYSMYHIRRGKGAETFTECYSLPGARYLICITSYTDEVGITAPIWDIRNLKTERLYECV